MNREEMSNQTITNYYEQDHDRLDERRIERRGHPVVEEAGVQEMPLVVVEVLLAKRPADALNRAAF